MNITAQYNNNNRFLLELQEVNTKNKNKIQFLNCTFRMFFNKFYTFKNKYTRESQVTKLLEVWDTRCALTEAKKSSFLSPKIIISTPYEKVVKFQFLDRNVHLVA